MAASFAAASAGGVTVVAGDDSAAGAAATAGVGWGAVAPSRRLGAAPAAGSTGAGTLTADVGPFTLASPLPSGTAAPKVSAGPLMMSSIFLALVDLVDGSGVDGRLDKAGGARG